MNKLLKKKKKLEKSKKEIKKKKLSHPFCLQERKIDSLGDVLVWVAGYKGLEKVKGGIKTYQKKFKGWFAIIKETRVWYGLRYKLQKEGKKRLTGGSRWKKQEWRNEAEEKEGKKEENKIILSLLAYDWSGREEEQTLTEPVKKDKKKKKKKWGHKRRRKRSIHRSGSFIHLNDQTCQHRSLWNRGKQ